ncbi:MAG: hypothetical protein HFH47_01410 [Bacilli bacterium]|nr:hypothetical protein [Bacilli bacterium]
MNNHGQALVVFVLVLPLIILIIAGVMEMGKLSLVKTEYENCITDTISYGLNNLDKDNVEEKMYLLLDKNIKGTKNIEIKDGIIKIHVTSNLEGMFSKLFKESYDINLTYKGYMLDGKNKIVKD